MKRRLLLVIFLALNSFLGAEAQKLTETWIVTNAPGTLRLPYGYIGPRLGYLKEWELTPSISTNVPGSESYYNSAIRLFVRFREPLILGANGLGTDANKITVDYDFRALEKTNPVPVTREEMRRAWKKSYTLLRTHYYRGRVFYDTRDFDSNQWVTVFTSDDKTRIVCVSDSGPISISENAGVGWKAIEHPAEYEFTISSTPKGSVIVAIISLGPQVKTLPITDKNWYCSASAADGSRLAITGGPSQSAPVLSISRTGSNVTISWPAAFKGFILQQSSDSLASNWSDLTNQVETVGTENQVVFSNGDGLKFFRLRSSILPNSN